ncbi:hypothetical protein LXL04_016272 [Taraxacum kok-saghyz]
MAPISFNSFKLLKKMSILPPADLRLFIFLCSVFFLSAMIILAVYTFSFVRCFAGFPSRLLKTRGSEATSSAFGF